MMPLYHFLIQQLREEQDNLEHVIRAAYRSIAGAKRHSGDQDIYIASAALNLGFLQRRRESVSLYRRAGR